MGIGLGIGYLTPVKTLMLWFDKQKGLATGLAVAGFGLAKVIASPLMEILLGARNNEGILVNATTYLYNVLYFSRYLFSNDVHWTFAVKETSWI